MRQTFTTAAAIREMRKRAGLTQVQIAERLGITQRCISGWEREGPPIPETRTIWRVADACEYRALLVGPDQWQIFTPDEVAAILEWLAKR